MLLSVAGAEKSHCAGAGAGMVLTTLQAPDDIDWSVTAGPVGRGLFALVRKNGPEAMYGCRRVHSSTAQNSRVTRWVSICSAFSRALGELDASGVRSLASGLQPAVWADSLLRTNPDHPQATTKM